MTLQYWGSHEPIVAGKLNGPVDELYRVWQAIAEIRRGQTPSTTPVFWARLVSESSGAYQWIQVRRNSPGTAWETYAGGLSSDGSSSTSSVGAAAYEASGGMLGLRVGADNGQVVLMRPAVSSAGALIFVFDPGPTTFLAKITGNSALTANTKWKYAWTEILLNNTGDDVAVTGARSGTTGSGWALNLCEINNTNATTVGGDGVNPAGAAYPSAFLRRPIGSAGTSDTHANDVIVMMHVTVPSSGTTIYVFSQPNAHDGTC